MRLFIDTSSNQKTIVRLGDEELVETSSLWHSQVVLPMIDKLLRKQGITLKDITKIEINHGPGSFTGLRVGTAIACALGYALGIPVDSHIAYSV